MQETTTSRDQDVAQYQPACEVPTSHSPSSQEELPSDEEVFASLEVRDLFSIGVGDEPIDSSELFDGHPSTSRCGMERDEALNFSIENLSDHGSSFVPCEIRMERARVRRQRNRESARRSNERRRDYIRDLEDVTKVVEDENHELARRYQELLDHLEEISQRTTGNDHKLVSAAIHNVNTLFTP